MMEIRELPGAPLGVEVTGLDLKAASDDDINVVVDAMHRRGKGVIVFRDQHLAPRDLEVASAKLAPRDSRSSASTVLPER